MGTQKILIFLIVLKFATVAITATKQETNVSLVPLAYQTKLDLWTMHEVLYCPVVFTITAEARSTSNEIKLRFRSKNNADEALKLNVTNLTTNKTILVSSVTKCTQEYKRICILLEDSFQAGDRLEIVVSDISSRMHLLGYDHYDSSTNTREWKRNGFYYTKIRDYSMLSLDGDQYRGTTIPMQFTIGLGGIWNKYKIIGSFNTLGVINDSLHNETRWTYFQQSPVFDTGKEFNIGFFISEFVNYTISTERNTKVSVWGPPSKIFQYGTTDGSTTAFANLTVSSASSLLNNYEKILDMKYPLDRLDIVLMDYMINVSNLYLGQIFLYKRFKAIDRKTTNRLVDDLSHRIAVQFIGVMADEPFGGKMHLTNYVKNICQGGIIYEDPDNMNLVQMLEGFLTPEIVLNGIRIYLKSQIWKRGTENEFFDAVEESISTLNATNSFLPTGVRIKDVIGIYDQIEWRHRQVNASLLQENNEIQLTFGYKNGTNFTRGFERWFPVQVKMALSFDNSSEILEDTFWIPPNTSVHSIRKIGGYTLTNSSNIEWFLVNKNRDGLYSTFYEGKLFSQLVSQLNKNCSIFSPRERYNVLLQVLDFYPNVPLGNYFILTNYFGQETESQLWSAVMLKLMRSKFLYICNDEIYQESRKHFVPKMESYIKSRGGLENIKGLPPHFQKGCILMRAPSCLRFASENLEKFESEGGWRKRIWFEAAGADPQNFEYLKQRYLNLSDESYSDSRKYFFALHWTSNDTLYEMFLNAVLDKSSDRLAFAFERLYPHYSHIALSESRLALLVNFAKTKFQERKISSFTFHNIVKFVLNIYQYSEFVSDTNLYEDLKLFIALQEQNLDAIEYSSLKRLINSIDEKVYNQESYWNRNGKEFLLWLKGFNEGYSIAGRNILAFRKPVA